MNSSAITQGWSCPPNPLPLTARRMEKGWAPVRLPLLVMLTSPILVQHSQFGGFSYKKMTVLEAVDMLDRLVDESDPDVDFPNSFHAFQTAEGIRKAHPDKGAPPLPAPAVYGGVVASKGCRGRADRDLGPGPRAPCSPPCPLPPRLVPPRRAPARPGKGPGSSRGAPGEGMGTGGEGRGGGSWEAWAGAASALGSRHPPGG